jgi:4-amino-4-deoxy-L-arabinose transferase-like glycosyltransferase
MKCFAPFASAALGQFFLAQAGSSWTLVPGIFFYGLSLWLLFRETKINPKVSFPAFEPLSPKIEAAAFILILVLAFFLRVYRMDSMPAGMHTDQGLTGEYGLWILKGWRPFFEIYSLQVPELLLGYSLAAWFGLFGASYLSFHLFFIFLGLAAYPLVYWTFRQWAGPRTALLSLAVMAVMRWNWTAVRNCHPSSAVAFYLFGGLAFWLHWVLKDKKASLYLSALFLGLGFYSYQIFKAVPFLCLVLVIYELRHGFKKPQRLALWGGIILAFALPLLAYFALNHTAGNREKDLFIGQAMADQHSLEPLWKEALSNILMFNRLGDMNPRHNLPGKRMLDDITGICFVLGLGWAWLRRKERAGFYPLAGFLLFMGVGWMTNDPANSNRLWILSAFTAYFAGLALEELGRRLAFLRKPAWVLPGLGLVLLAAMTVQNASVYFIQMDRDPACQTAFGSEQTYIGRSVENLEKSAPGKYRFFLPPLYVLNHTVKFLSDAAGADVVPFTLDDLAAGKLTPGKDAVFFLEEGKAGVLDFLKTLFPGGKEDRFSGPDGRTFVFRYEIQKEDLDSLKGWNRGIRGTYWYSQDFSGSPVTVKSDPLLNFTNKRDFPFTNPPPFTIRWRGSLDLPLAGPYQFEALTRDGAAVWVDGQKVSETGKTPEKAVNLAKGSHSLRVDFMKTGGDWMALHLIWKHPGSTQWEVVPATTFGITKPLGLR